MPSPRVLSLAVRSIIIVFVLSIVFEELGLAEQTMLVAFGIAFGALMLGLAIAFGMGGRDLAKRFLEKKIVRGRRKRKRRTKTNRRRSSAGSVSSPPVAVG